MSKESAIYSFFGNEFGDLYLRFSPLAGGYFCTGHTNQ
jgi:hypothetical protein